MVIPAYAGALNTKEQRPVALITGASSGIGLDLARLMAPDFDLIITARGQSQLEEIARELQAKNGNRVHAIAADLARADAPAALWAEITRRSACAWMRSSTMPGSGCMVHSQRPACNPNWK